MTAPRHAALAAAALASAATVGAGACTSPDPDRPWSPDELALVLSLSPLPPPPPSPGNPHADDPRAARLGRALFFDPALSANGRISCASCHDPARHFTDGRPRSIGLSGGGRNAPSVMTAPYFQFLSWDGRKDGLVAQSLRPLETAHEMSLAPADTARVIAERHREAYEAAFGPLDLEPEGAAHAVYLNAGRALESYQRRLVPGPAPFDRYVAALRAGDPDGGGVLSPAARRGLRAFVGAGQCVQCHSGPLLSDGEFHNLGLAPGAPDDRDPGRALGVRLLLADPLRCGGSGESGCDALRYLDPTFPELLGAFRTPSLRNVAGTAPYMHAGQLATLEEVIAFYAQRPGVATVGTRDPLLRLVPRRLSSADLIAFLRTLTGALPGPEWLGPPAAEAAGGGGASAPTGAEVTAGRSRPAGRPRPPPAGRSRRARR